MSQSPWPEDLYAVARQDWCRSVPTPEGGSAAQLMCSNLARQCGSFTNATRDRQRIARTAPELQELLKSPEIERWEGRCPVAQATGVCGLGGATSYREQLWGAFAQPREDEIYRKIAGLKQAHPPTATGGDVAAEDGGLPHFEVPSEAVFASAASPEGALAMSVAHVNARPRRVVNDYNLLGLPFLT